MKYADVFISPPTKLDRRRTRLLRELNIVKGRRRRRIGRGKPEIII